MTQPRRVDERLLTGPDARTSMRRRALSLQLVATPGVPAFGDLPWNTALEAWTSDRIVQVVRGISRHIVRFVDYDGVLYALKELPESLARREFRLLRELDEVSVPVVEAIGVVTDRGEDAPLDAILITRFLEFSLPYRALFSGRSDPALREHLIDALVMLLVRLHLAGFWWGDCSLSNTLFRRDAGALEAHLVDAETSELHEKLSDGQRLADVERAALNVGGELMDVQAEHPEAPLSIDPVELADEVRRRYAALYDEVTREEVFSPHETYRVESRILRLNELGFDVAEVQLRREGDIMRLRLDPGVVETGHNRRRLQLLAGLDVSENQARRLLNDLRRYRSHLEREGGRPLSETVAGYRWLLEVFEPTIAAIPPELRGKREPAELFHEVLDHRWYLSERAGRDIGTERAVGAYVRDILPERPNEQAILESGEVSAD